MLLRALENGVRLQMNKKLMSLDLTITRKLAKGNTLRNQTFIRVG